MRRTLLLAWYAASVGLGLAVIGLAALAQRRRDHEQARLDSSEREPSRASRPLSASTPA